MKLWFLVVILAVVILVFVTFLQSDILKHKNEKENFLPVESTVFMTGIQSIILLLLLPFTNFTLTDFEVFKSVELWILLLAIVILDWLVNLSYFSSLKVKSISLSTIFWNTSFIFSTFFGWLLLNEKMYFWKFLGLFFIFSAILLTIKKSEEFEKNHWFAFLTGFLVGIIGLIENYTVNKFNLSPVLYLFAAYLLTLIPMFFYYRKIIIERLKKSKLKNFKFLIITSTGYLFYNLLLVVAYKMGAETGKVQAMVAFEIFLVILVEYFYKKQKEQLWLKIFAFVLALMGVLVLGLK